MKPSTRASLLFVLFAGIFSYGLIRLFSLQFASGEVYPELSSLRADPLGAKLLYDTLTLTPGIKVTRNFLPVETLEPSGTAILLLAVKPESLDNEAQLKAFENLAGRGNRVVVALNWAYHTAPSGGDDLQKAWKIRFGFDPGQKQTHHLYFARAEGWQTLDQVDGKALAIERAFGKGSVELLAESSAFDNQSTVAMDRLGIVSTAIGAESQVMFDEQHFGMEESGSVIGLARRFRLGGAFIGLAVCAVLFIWRNASVFPPPAASATAERLAGRTSLSGLLTLLRRNIPQRELAGVCWREWLSTNRRDVTPARLKAVEAVLRERSSKPLEALREIQTVLQAKGPL
jgi:hypothetical protein